LISGYALKQIFSGVARALFGSQSMKLSLSFFFSKAFSLPFPSHLPFFLPSAT